MELDRLYRDYLRSPHGAAKEQLGRGLEQFFLRDFTQRFGAERAQDLTQSGIETVWRKLPSFRPEHGLAFGRWVGRIAHFMLLHEAQRSRAKARESGEFDSTHFCHPRTGPSTRLRQRERMRLLESELRHLDSKLRKAIVDQLLGGDIQAFAEREGLPSATVRTHRRRGRETLRRRIDQRERTPSTLS